MEIRFIYNNFEYYKLNVYILYIHIYLKDNKIYKLILDL